jgi:GAF domain-containing protein
MHDNEENRLFEALRELSDLLLEEETLQTTTSRIAELAHRTIPHSGAVAVAVAEDGRQAPLVVDSGELGVNDFDSRQYDLQIGPCYEAMQDGQYRSIEAASEETRWPTYATEAAALGINSVLSLPLSVRDAPMGAINVYSQQRKAFTDEAFQVAALYAMQAGVAIANAQVYQASRRFAGELRTALDNRPRIEQAKGLLMAREGIGPNEAFDRLVKLSQNSNTKVRDVAQNLVDEAVAAGEPDRPAH